MLRILIVAALLAPAPALAAPQEKERERRICKREKAATGSNVRAKRICLTPREWEQSLEANRQTTKMWQQAIDGAQRAN